MQNLRQAHQWRAIWTKCPYRPVPPPTAWPVCAACLRVLSAPPATEFFRWIRQVSGYGQGAFAWGHPGGLWLTPPEGTARSRSLPAFRTSCTFHGESVAIFVQNSRTKRTTCTKIPGPPRGSDPQEGLRQSRDQSLELQRRIGGRQANAILSDIRHRRMVQIFIRNLDVPGSEMIHLIDKSPF